MFSKKKKKVEISAPSNFQHRVHTGFDNSSHKFVGLPKQWASLVTDDTAGAQSPHRPSPLVDPSAITPTDIIDLKTVVRGGNQLAAGHGQHSEHLPPHHPGAEHGHPHLTPRDLSQCSPGSLHGGQHGQHGQHSPPMMSPSPHHPGLLSAIQQQQQQQQHSH